MAQIWLTLRFGHRLKVLTIILGLTLLSIGCALNFGRGRDSAKPLPETNPPQAEAVDNTATPVEPESDEAVEQTDTTRLREAVSVDGIRQHLAKFQEIADSNDGLRTSGTPGYDASAAYVQAQLEAAGYQVTVQSFDFPFFYDASQLEQTRPDSVTYKYLDDFAALVFSVSGEVTAPIQPIDVTIPPRGGTTSGCEVEDFADFEPGQIALLQRGTCPFAAKARNAEDAGASAVLIFNEGQSNRQDVVRGTLGGPGINIPVVGLSFGLGETLVQLSETDEVIMHVQTRLISETRQTVNVIADTSGGRDDFVVLVGAHLDSVPTGPGIQDNGSGSATILEIARQLAELKIEPTNKVRFAFWGAEEFGLIGSRYYVDQLSRQELNQIALNLNFDMIASPNYSRFVYDGDSSRFRSGGFGPPPPRDSAAIELVFQDYFADHNLPLAETAFDGRSDYGPFIREGIPAGGLFTGAEEEKPASEASVYGGEAGVAYDACYHLPCDTIDNINWQALDEMSDAAAHAVMIFAMTDKAVGETTN